MKLLFLVNGSESSAAAFRARAFSECFSGKIQTEFAYRLKDKQRTILEFLKKTKKYNPDLVYVMDCAYSGVIAAFLCRKNWILDTGDLAYELTCSSQLQGRVGQQLVRFVEYLATHFSQGIIVRGSFHKEILERENNLSAECVTFVPDGVFCDSLASCEGSAVRQRYGLEDHVVLGMVGSMVWSARHQFCYGWDLVEALALLPSGLPVKALLVGDGDGRAKLEARARELGVYERIVFTGTLPMESLGEYITAMDICVSTQSNDRVGNVRTTGKLPLYLACGRYVMASEVVEARRVLTGIGSVLPYSGVRDDTYPERMAAEICALMQQPERLAVAELARQRARENYDYHLLTQQVEVACHRALVHKSKKK